VNNRKLPTEVAAGQRVEIADHPDPSASRRLLDFVFERIYLSSTESFPNLAKLRDSPRQLAWRQATRLPVHPTRGADEQLPLRWQRMLTTLHGLNRRLAIVLMRNENETALYFGTSSIGGEVDNLSAVTQLERAAAGEIPGLCLEPLSREQDQGEEVFRKLRTPLWELKSCGAITGLPSTRTSPSAAPLGSASPASIELHSGLGQIAHGIKGADNHECSYAVVVIADAVPDPDISGIIDRLRTIGARVHSEMRRTVQETQGSSRSERDEISKGKLIGTVGGMFAAALLPFGGLGGAVASRLLMPAGYFASHMLNPRGSRTESTGSTTGTEEIDMVAQHCKTVVERHIERLNAGRSFGFWNAGIYVLGDTDDTVRTVCGMLRAAYSGDDSHIEPIRSILFPSSFGAAAYVCDFRHVPLRTAEVEEWHPLGLLYQDVSTPLNTEELAITTALPRKDVPGLRMQKNQVQFAMNGPLLEGGRPVVLGELLGPGGVDAGSYRFDVNGLVRHGLLVGTTGSGKSTTCRRLIAEARRAGVPFLILEPAKDDYARWALDHNRTAAKNERIDLYMPGEVTFDGQAVEPLLLNPLEPARPDGARADPLGRAERVVAILNASMPMQEVLPILMEEAVMELATGAFGINFKEWPNDGFFPKLDQLDRIVRANLYGGGGLYDVGNRANLYAAMKNRVASLTRGRRGEVLNVDRSTPASRLFERPAVVNLSRFGSEADKALIMALLLLGMYEWRMGRYAADAQYRDNARRGHLAHLTVVEEAHTVLRQSGGFVVNEANPQAMVSRMFSDMLAEVRQYGQGLLVVDQDPSQLITGTIKNTSFRIVHRLPHQQDREALSASMLLRPDQRDFLSLLPTGQAIISTEQDDAPCWVKIKGEGAKS
jgi:hypothetical protein